MEKFALLIFCITFYSISATDCGPDLVPCRDVHDIATITCGGGVGDPCTITCGAHNIDCTADIAGILVQDENPIEHIDARICKEKCREQSKIPEADPVCEFYRWEEKGAGSKCILQTVCEPDMRCLPDEPDHSCVTGQIGCTEDGNTACSLDEAVVYHHEKFHLICPGGTGDINIYSPDPIHDIPTGTVCYTIHKCDAWVDFIDTNEYYRKLAVSCSDEGTWQKIDGAGPGDESKNMVVGNTLVEPTCESECATMVLIEDNITAEGTQLICDADLEGFNLVNGNSCVLICDNHFAMSISCEFKYDGAKDWMDENRMAVTKEDVKCY